MTTASVLVVEHDVLVRHPLAKYLRECGYRVVEAITYDEAREWALISTTTSCLAQARSTFSTSIS